MSDVVDDYIENLEVNYVPISDNEALIELGSGNPIFSKSYKNGNLDGYKKVSGIEDFMETCYRYCTVYKIGG